MAVDPVTPQAQVPAQYTDVILPFAPQIWQGRLMFLPPESGILSPAEDWIIDGLGLGACSQNGVGIFWDRQGDDYYRGGNSTLGHAGQTSCGAGRLAENFGFFFDSGGTDNYPPERENDSKLVTRQYGIFVDD